MYIWKELVGGSMNAPKTTVGIGKKMVAIKEDFKKRMTLEEFTSTDYTIK